jgi:hypothetical protein
MVLGVFCTDVKLVAYRVNLFNTVTQNSRNCLLKMGYYSEAGVFLLDLERPPATDDRRGSTTFTTAKGTTITGNHNCTINIYPTFTNHYHGPGTTPQDTLSKTEEVPAA